MKGAPPGPLWRAMSGWEANGDGAEAVVCNPFIFVWWRNGEGVDTADADRGVGGFRDVGEVAVVDGCDTAVAAAERCFCSSSS